MLLIMLSSWPLLPLACVAVLALTTGRPLLGSTDKEPRTRWQRLCVAAQTDRGLQNMLMLAMFLTIAIAPAIPLLVADAMSRDVAVLGMWIFAAAFAGWQIILTFLTILAVDARCGGRKGTPVRT